VRADRRSWPYPWSRLEELSARAGVDPEVVREWLRAEVERRRHEQAVARASLHVSGAIPGTTPGDGLLNDD
jgi:hypothetical protein